MNVFEHGYALVVGVAHYRYPDLGDLPLAVLNDAVDLARTLWDPDRCGYRADRVRLLLDEQATAEGIRDGLVWLAERCARDENATAVVFYSGHGWRKDGPTSGESFLAAHDAHLGPGQEGLISGTELTTKLRAILAARLAIVFDCCYSAGVVEVKAPSTRRPLQAGLPAKAYEELGKGKGRVLLASSTADEESSVLPDDRNSLFSSCLLRGLHGEAVNGGGTIGAYELFKFTAREVRRQSLDRQHPVCKAEIEDDFALALCTSPRKKEPEVIEAHEAADRGIDSTPGDRAGRDIIKHVLIPSSTGQIRIGGS